MIEIKNVSFKYKEKKEYSIHKINLPIKKGECIVISGESGCGKSTLMRCINGLCPRFFEGEIHGQIFFNDKDTKTKSISDFSGMISSVFQNPDSQFFTLDTLSDIVFACENFGIEKKEIEKRLRKIMDLLSLENLVGKKLTELSGGEKQKIAIASMLILDNKAILLDEPSANLDYRSIQLLKKILSKLKREGYTIIVMEHRLYYLRELADRLIVMKEGKIIENISKDCFLHSNHSFFNDLGLRSMEPFKRWTRAPDIQSGTAQSSLFIQGLSFRYSKNAETILKEIELKLYPGDKVALIGKNGCGKTTLAKVLCGLRKEQAGKVLIFGETVSAKNRFKNIAYVMQNVDLQIFGSNVKEDLRLAHKNIEDIEYKVEELLKKMNLIGRKKEHPMTLSMGQKQRLVIASALISRKNIYIFDEPTSGLDYRNMMKVCSLINQTTENGNTSLIITHDFEFIINVCNRIVLLENGRIAEDFYLHDVEKLKEIFITKL